jgi:hypothetical protein
MRTRNRSIPFPRSLVLAGALTVAAGVYALVGAVYLNGDLAIWALVLGSLQLLAGGALLARTIAGYLLAALPAAMSLVLALMRGRPLFLPAVALNLGVVLLLVGSEGRYWLVSVWPRRAKASHQDQLPSDGVPWRPTRRVHAADDTRTGPDRHAWAA